MTKRRSARVIGQLALVLALLLVCLPSAQADSPGTQGSDTPSSPSDTAVGWVVSNTPVGGYGTIIHTRDGGNTWVRQGSKDEIPNVLLNGVWAVDPNNVWVVGANEGGYGVILRSSDGGQTWTRQGSAAQIPDAGLASISAVDNNTAWAVGAQGVILHTRDGGNTWTRQTGGTVPETLLAGVYAVDAQTAWACGDVSGGYGTILRTTDGGTTWERPGYKKLPASLYVLTVHALDADTVWGVGNGQMVVHTADAGSTWHNLSPIQPNFLDANGVVALNRDTVWVVMDYGVIWRTDNGGSNWTLQESGEHGHHLVRVSALDSDNAWLTGALTTSGTQLGVILHTEDGGDTWSSPQQTPVNVDWWGVSFVDGHFHRHLPLIMKSQ
jgi:photosystem II stability/assembly factor-like uncharacterized protein